MKQKQHLLLAIIFITTLSLIVIGCSGGNGGGTITTTYPDGVCGIVTNPLGTTSIQSTSLVHAGSTFSAIRSAKIKQFRDNSFGSQVVANEKIVKFQDGLSESQIQQIVSQYGGQIKKKIYGFTNTYVININSASQGVKDLANRNSDVISCTDNGIIHALAVPNDEYYATDQIWNTYALNLPNAWDIATGISTITVAVVDTGVSTTHPDLAGNLDLTDARDFSGDYTKPTTDPSDTTYYNAENQYSHGTHVSGIIGAIANGPQAPYHSGIAGIAWSKDGSVHIKILPVKVLDKTGSGNDGTIAAGINWAVANGANVINLSLGASSSFGFAQTIAALDNAFQHNVIVVAAAGNESSSVDFPANYSSGYGKVIAVSALGSDMQRASYSNYGSQIDVCAPGGDGGNFANYSYQMVLSTSYDKSLSGDDGNCYVYMSGTSMAAPHISGLVALMLAKGVSPSQVLTRLKSGSINLGNSQYYGAGLPDAYAILNNSTPVMAKMRVYLKAQNGSIVGTVHNVSAGGYYCIDNISPGNYSLVAFLDANLNGVLDSGEKYGTVPVTINNNIIQNNVNINSWLTYSAVTTVLKK